MRFEREKSTPRSSCWLDIYYDGPLNRKELDELRQKCRKHACCRSPNDNKPFTAEELDRIHEAVEAARDTISPEDKPQVIIGPDIARVLVRPDDIIEIYGHGALAQAQILYPRTEETAAQAQVARFPGSKAIIDFSLGF